MGNEVWRIIKQVQTFLKKCGKLQQQQKTRYHPIALCIYKKKRKSLIFIPFLLLTRSKQKNCIVYHTLTQHEIQHSFKLFLLCLEGLISTL